MRPFTACVVLMVLLAACSRPEPEPAAVAAMRAALVRAAARPAARQGPALPSRSASAAPDPAADTLFLFGEIAFPQYFPGERTTQAFGPWLYRHYPETSVYLGLNAGNVYVMGGPFGGEPSFVGPLEAFVAASGTPTQVRAGAFAAATAGDFIVPRAVALDANGRAIAGAAIQWTSTDPARAKIASGRVLALSAGEVGITASAGNASGSASLTIAQRAVAPGQVDFLLGPEETVFDYATDKCSPTDTPDGPAQAVRLPDGSIYMTSVNDPSNYVMAGPGFSSLTRRCSPVLVSLDSTAPQTYRNREWLYATYLKDGLLHGIIHNEYHDAAAAGCLQGDTGTANPCWYNSITHAVSADNGLTFSSPVVLAAAPVAWNPLHPARTQPHGYFNPSNVVRRDDGYYYVTFFAIPDPSVPGTRGLCAARTQDIGNPASWRAWDGQGYTLSLASPYVTGHAMTACSIVLRSEVRGSITWNTYLGRFMNFDANAADIGGSRKCGLMYHLSADLVDWTAPKLVRASYLPAFGGPGLCPPPGQGPAGAMAYGSIIDHDSSSVNFETAGQTGYAYHVSFTAQGDAYPRRIVRQPFILVKSASFTGDLEPPIGSLDVPAANAPVSGSSVLVAGWAADIGGGVGKVEVFVDSALAGEATRGMARPDVAAVYPWAPVDSGYTYRLDTTMLANGPHTLMVRATDPSGNFRDFQVQVTIANQP